MLDALRLSAITSTITLALAIIFGTPLAYLLARYAVSRARSFVDLLVDLPIVLPPTVAGVALLVALGRRGVVGQHLDDCGHDDRRSRRRRSCWRSSSSRRRSTSAPSRPAFEASSRSTRAWRRRSARRRCARSSAITLPLAWPSIVAGAILCWARALSELGATLIFAGNFEGRTQTMPLAIISAFESGRSIDVPIALSVILVVAAAVLLLLLRAARAARTRYAV